MSSTSLPDQLDVWRMVSANRAFQGKLPLAALPRLRAGLAGEGEVLYDAQFGRDTFGIAYLELRLDTALPLVCQRTLEVYEEPVLIHQRLGLILNEQDEAGLPESYEALLVGDGQLHLADVIEDELILAIPVVPIKPGEPLDWIDPLDEGEQEMPESPFAALGRLKKH